MRSLLLGAAILVSWLHSALCDIDVSTASFPGCDQPKGNYPVVEHDGFVPGLYVASANHPGATVKSDGTLNNRNIVCAHQDSRTSGASIIIPWSTFDQHSGDTQGNRFNWTFVEEQIKPWADRGQKVAILIWPAVQQSKQLFPGMDSATPQYILDLPDVTFECPSGGADQPNVNGDTSGTIPIPKIWEERVWRKFAQALKTFKRRYENDDRISYFRFGIGVGDESYPANGATTPWHYCMGTFISQFGGAEEAYNVWKGYVGHRIRAFRTWNSTKPIVVTLNDFYTRPNQNIDDFPNWIAYQATRDFQDWPMLGLVVQGATTRHIEQHNNNNRCYANWCQLFEDNMDKGIPLQLQTPLHSGVNGRPGPDQPYPCNITDASGRYLNNGKYGCTSTGNLKNLTDFAKGLGVRSFELYPYEWHVANDINFHKNLDAELRWHDLFGDDYNDALDSVSNSFFI